LYAGCDCVLKVSGQCHDPYPLFALRRL
jgi:hypothetical protein